MLHERFKWGQAIGLLGEAIASDNPQVSLSQSAFLHVDASCLPVPGSSQVPDFGWMSQVMFCHCSAGYLGQHDAQVIHAQSNICCFTTWFAAAVRHC